MDQLVTEQEIQLESEIQEIIEKDNKSNCTVHFQYEPGSDNGVNLSIITHNPIHGTSFLFYKCWGLTKYLAVKNAYDYATRHMKAYSNFTVEWKEFDGDNKTQISYFVGRDMFDVLNKFYHNKDSNKNVIFSIKYNPLS